MALPGRPGEERTDGLLVVDAVGEPVGVDVGLCGRGGVTAAGAEPGEEDFGGAEAVLGVGPRGGPHGPGGGRRAHPGELMPLAELPQQPLVRMPVESGEALVQPGLVVQQLLVGGGQHAAAD